MIYYKKALYKQKAYIFTFYKSPAADGEMKVLNLWTYNN